jgi:hypothetical protein
MTRGAPWILLRQCCQGLVERHQLGAALRFGRSNAVQVHIIHWHGSALAVFRKSVAQYALHLYAASRLRDVGLYSGALPYQQACFADIISFGRDHPVRAG